MLIGCNRRIENDTHSSQFCMKFLPLIAEVNSINLFYGPVFNIRQKWKSPSEDVETEVGSYKLLS